MLALSRLDPAREFQPFVLIKSGGGLLLRDLLLGSLGGGGGLLRLGLPGGGLAKQNKRIEGVLVAGTGACEGRDT